jgi:hypothetical protein
MEQALERSDELEAIDEHALDDAQNGAVIQATGKRIYVGYTLKTASNQTYVGRTSGFGTPEQIVAMRFANHHQHEYDDLHEGGWVGSPKLEVGTSNYAAIRGWEEIAIQRAGGPWLYGGTSANKISGINWRYSDHSDPRKRAKYERYMAAGYALVEQTEQKQAAHRVAHEASGQRIADQGTQAVSDYWTQRAPPLPTLDPHSHSDPVIDKD